MRAVAEDIHFANLCQASDCTHSLLFILFAHLLVISEFHRERSKAGCDGTKCRWIVPQLCQCCSSRHNAGVLPVANWNDVTTSLCNVGQYNAELVLVNCDLQNNSSYCAYFLLIVSTSAVSMTNYSSLSWITQNIHYTNCCHIADMTLPILCDLGDTISR